MQTTELEYFNLSVVRLVAHLAVEAILLNRQASNFSYGLVKAIKELSPFGISFTQTHGLESILHRLAAKL